MAQDHLDFAINYPLTATSPPQGWKTELRLSSRPLYPVASIRSSSLQVNPDHLVHSPTISKSSTSIRNPLTSDFSFSFDETHARLDAQRELPGIFQTARSAHITANSFDSYRLVRSDFPSNRPFPVIDCANAMSSQGAIQLVPECDTTDRTMISTPTFTCRFSFLNCRYASTDEFEWKQHNLSHFQGQVLPQSNVCPLCDMTFRIPDPNVSWAAHMSHIAQHLKDGMSYASTHPDLGLFKHMWDVGLISDSDYQELIEHYQLSSSRRHDRRERRGFPVPQSNL